MAILRAARLIDLLGDQLSMALRSRWLDEDGLPIWLVNPYSGFLAKPRETQSILRHAEPCDSELCSPVSEYSL